VGLMSGTSCDGISAAAVRFRPASARGAALAADVVGTAQVTYAPAQRERLLAAMQGATPQEYCRLHAELGAWLADAAARLLAESGVARTDVAAVASHGQTIWHEPGHSTWQLGDASVIAERLGIDVVCDFRTRDVAAGGQGAPLVSIADVLLFAGEGWRALQNLGGIGNVTVVPPHGGGESHGGVRAFDTGPGCAVIDAVARQVRPELPYDVDGALARAGTPALEVVDALLAEPYFRAEPPKTTGRELFSAAYVAQLVARTREARPGASDEDLVATAVALTAHSVADAYARFVVEPVQEVLVSGGGARNPVLVDAIRAACAARGVPAVVRLFDEVFFDAEAKEAVAFALLGYLHLHGRPGNVASATGARGPRVLGAHVPGAVAAPSTVLA
ncbi:MAG TPA: anhydro-N-acetylmuramic acid kinase, partial [Gemmatirosa sp.]|nr:anhydro-N-acetylmuramic acid kinase [Gemmatirosa sp.]